MSFESTAEGRVGVDGADRRRKTVPHVGTADRESPSSELGPSSLCRGCSDRSGAELPMRSTVITGSISYHFRDKRRFRS